MSRHHQRQSSCRTHNARCQQLSSSSWSAKQLFKRKCKKTRPIQSWSAECHYPFYAWLSENWKRKLDSRVHDTTAPKGGEHPSTLCTSVFVSSGCPHLSAERASVLGVLADFNLFHHLPEGGPVTGAILPHNPHLLGALGLRSKRSQRVRDQSTQDTPTQHNPSPELTSTAPLVADLMLAILTLQYGQ